MHLINAAVTGIERESGPKITLEHRPDSNALRVMYDIMQPHAYASSTRGEWEMIEGRCVF